MKQRKHKEKLLLRETGVYDRLQGGWMNLSGDIFYCKDVYGHLSLIREISGVGEYEAEKLGYIKLLTSYHGEEWLQPLDLLNQEQHTALDEWAEKYWPNRDRSWLKEWAERAGL